MLAPVASPAQAFVGREFELTRLEDALDLLDARTPGSVAIEGEPGIGKTRLLGELRRRAEDRHHVVLEGRAAEFDRDVPFGVVVDALDAYLASHDPEVVERWDPEVREELGAILPSLRGRSWSAPAGAGEERYRTHRAMRVAARAARRIAAARDRAGRPPLGGRCVDRADRIAPAPRSGRARAARARVPPGAGARSPIQRARGVGPEPDRARGAQRGRGRRAARRPRRPVARDRLRAGRRKPVLPGAAGPRRRAPAEARSHRRRGCLGAARGRRRLGRGAGSPVAAGAAAARCRGRRRRAVRAQPRRRHRAAVARRRPDGARRAAGRRPRAPDGGAAALRLPSRPRAPGRLRGHAGRLEARGARTRRRRARRTRGGRRRAGPSRRVLGHTERRGGDRRAARGGPRDGLACAGGRGALVRGGAAPVAGGRPRARGRRADVARLVAAGARRARALPVDAAGGDRVVAGRATTRGVWS